MIDTGEILARRLSKDQGTWVVSWAEIEDLCSELEAAHVRIAAVRAVLVAHGPDGMTSAGYDLWADVADALYLQADDA